MPNGNHEKHTGFLLIGSDLLLIGIGAQLNIWMKAMRALLHFDWCTYAYLGLTMMSWGIHLLRREVYGKEGRSLREQEQGILIFESWMSHEGTIGEETS